MLGVRDETDKIELFLVMAITVLYLVFIATGKASMDGFIILATLVIRKILLGENGNSKPTEGEKR